jgi:hypothetical protein
MKTKSALYAELLEASKAHIAANISAHKLRTSRIKKGHQGRRSLNQALADLPLDVFAIGDSWFEYPLYNNGPWLEETGIVAQVQLGSMGNPPPVILNQALHGQTTTEMLSWENQDKYISLLQDSSQWLNQKPDAILVSVGGDDIVGDQLAIYLDYHGNGLNQARLDGVLDSVKASYTYLFEFCQNFANGVPIIGHCYDYAIPNGVVPVCVETAWLQPSLEFAGYYDFAEQEKIVADMITQFHDLLASLAAVKTNNFTLVDTRGTLIRDATSPTGWANEIHPYFGGFTALAKKFLGALQNLPGRAGS